MNRGDHRQPGVPPAAEADGRRRLPDLQRQGFVQDVTGGSNVIGPWYAYGDGVGPNASVANGSDAANSDSDGRKGGFPASGCSQTRPPAALVPPSDLATSKMCTDGVAAVVMNKGGAPDYRIFGAGESRSTSTTRVAMPACKRVRPERLQGHLVRLQRLHWRRPLWWHVKRRRGPPGRHPRQLPVHGRARHRLTVLDGRGQDVVSLHADPDARRDRLGRHRRSVLPDPAVARGRHQQVPVQPESSAVDPVPGVHQRDGHHALRLLRRQPGPHPPIQSSLFDARQSRVRTEEATCGSTAGGFLFPPQTAGGREGQTHSDEGDDAGSPDALMAVTRRNPWSGPWSDDLIGGVGVEAWAKARALEGDPGRER